MMKYYGYFRSSSSYRLRIAFNLKKVTPEFVSVHLRRGGGEQKSQSYTQLNPQQLVPTLLADQEVLTQTMAILEWLDETIPDPALLPEDPFLRARVRAFSLVIACEIHPLQNLRVLQYLKNELGGNDETAKAWCQRWIGDGLSACEALLAREPEQGPFCFGQTPGLADICLVPQVFSAARFDVDTRDMPRLMQVYEACQALPEFKDAHPSLQSDVEP